MKKLIVFQLCFSLGCLALAAMGDTKAPFFKAAELLDFVEVKKLLGQKWPPKDRSLLRDKYLADLTWALRLSAPEVNRPDMFSFVPSNPKIDNRKKSSGYELIQYLLKNGANPNETAGGYFASTFYLTKDSRARNLLKAFGGKLTDQEQLLEAIEKQDLERVKKLYQAPKFKLYGSQTSLQMPFALAVSSLFSDGYRGNSMVFKLGPEKKRANEIVNFMLSHSSNKIDWKKEGHTRSPLAQSFMHQYFELSEALMKRGAYLTGASDLRQVLRLYDQHNTVENRNGIAAVSNPALKGPGRDSFLAKEKRVLLKMLKRTNSKGVDISGLGAIYQAALKRSDVEVAEQLKKMGVELPL